MPTNYPGAIDTFDLGSPIPTDPKNDPSLSGEVTDLNDAVIAIESELGVVPSGTHASVADRIDDLDTRVQGIEGFVAGADVEYVNQAGDTMTGALNIPNLGFTTEGLTEAMDSDQWPEGLVIQAMNSGSWFTLGEVLNIKESSVRRGQIALGKNGGMWIRGLAGNGPTFGAWQKVWTDSNQGAGSGLDADTLDGQSSAYYRDRANHTGTQVHTTISDFDTGVQQNRLNQLTVPNGNVNMNGYKITNLGAPTSGAHAVNRDFLDSRFTSGHLVEYWGNSTSQDFSSPRSLILESRFNVPSHWNSWGIKIVAHADLWTTESTIEAPTCTISLRLSAPYDVYPGNYYPMDHAIVSIPRASGNRRYSRASLSGTLPISAKDGAPMTDANFRVWMHAYYGDTAGVPGNANIGWDSVHATATLIRLS